MGYPLASRYKWCKRHFMSKPQSLKKILSDAGVAVTDTQVGQLQQYQLMVTEWNRKLNLIAGSTLPDFAHRHILDSAQLAKYLPAAATGVEAEPLDILDVGSGAGLPGLVLAVLCPQHKFTLAEIIQKKASFLVTAAYKLGVKNVTVHAGDVKLLPAEKYHVVTARAVAALADLLDLTDLQLKPNGYWLLLKGQAVEHEINALKSLDRFADALTIEQHRSIVTSTGNVLVIRQV